MKVPENVKKMYEVLSCIPPDFETAKALFAEYQPSEEELMWLAVELTDNTFCEYKDWLLEKSAPEQLRGKQHRYYLYDTITFLLEQGLKPNAIIDADSSGEAENAMFLLQYTDGPDVAAQIMRLYMEHGGNPNLYIKNNYGDTLISEIEFDIYEFGDYEKPENENLVQCVMVLQAYGGGWNGKDGKFHQPFSMREGYDSAILKEFEKFDYRIGVERGHPGSVHVFEKATGKVVADYV